MNIFAGNLSFATSETDLKNLFEKFGSVSSAVIMMRKDKKNPKSRGFGFIEMPDEAQALAAIAALNTTEFMGRALTVEIARPKEEKEPLVDAPAEKEDQLRPHSEERPWQKRGQEEPWRSRPGRYKGGRRTRSYVNEHGSTEMRKSATPWQRNKNNPLRWRKDSAQPKPWLKSQGESKSRHKSEGGFKPWVKPEGESKPWHKAEGEARPWKKRASGRSKPWEKSGTSRKKSGRPERTFRKGRS